MAEHQSSNGPVDRPALRGRAVVLRALAPDDVERVAAIQAEPEVARWWGEPDLAELRRKAAGETDEQVFAIEAEGELVGLIHGARGTRAGGTGC